MVVGQATPRLSRRLPPGARRSPPPSRIRPWTPTVGSTGTGSTARSKVLLDRPFPPVEELRGRFGWGTEGGEALAERLITIASGTRGSR